MERYTFLIFKHLQRTKYLVRINACIYSAREKIIAALRTMLLRQAQLAASDAREIEKVD
jgi:hypothetical protein